MNTYTHSPGGRLRGRHPLFLIILCTACTVWCTAAGPAEEPVRMYTEDEGRAMLRSELKEFERYIETTMKAAQDILVSRKTPADDLAKLTSWQKVQQARFRVALAQADPLLALVDALAVVKSLSRYLGQDASAAELPETTREVALDMLKRREDRLLQIASRYLPEESMAALLREIESFAASQPIPDAEILKPDTRSWTAPLFSVWGKSQATVSGLLQIPLMPGRALKGVSDSGKALAGIRETSAEAVQVASELPERIRIEFQTALNSLIEQRSEIIEILAAVDSVSTNLSATAQASDRAAGEIQMALTRAQELLPAGEALAIAVERVVVASSGLVQSLQAYAPPAGPAGDGTGEPARKFDIKEYEETATAITQAAHEVREMLAVIRTLVSTGSDPEKKKEGAGFDIREYGAAAESIHLSAAELRAVLGEVRAISEDEAFHGRMAMLMNAIDGAAKRTAGHARSVIDHFTLRMLQAAGVVFLLGCLYTVIRSRRTGTKS